MKKFIVIIISLFLVFALSSCGKAPQTTLKCLCGASSHTTKGSAVLDLTGTWKQFNSGSEDSWQVATIKGSTITVNWISDNGDTKSLYWAGSFKTPGRTGDAYAWTSKNDKGRTSVALLASSDDTKEFAYQSGVLSYEVTVLGTTTTVKLKKE